MPLPVGEWTHITLTYDGSSRAAGLRLYLNGAPAATRTVRDSLTRSILPFTSADVFDPFLGLAVGTRFREKAPVGSGIDELRVFKRDLTPVEIAFLQDEALAASPDLETELTELLTATDARVVAARSALTAARARQNELATSVPQVLVMGDAPEPTPTFVLNRGVYSDPGERVHPKGLDAVLAWDDALAAEPPRARALAVRSAPAAHGARVRQSPLADALRPRHRRDERGLRRARRDSDASRAARLARRRVHGVGLGRQGAASADRHVGDLSTELQRVGRAARARRGQRALHARSALAHDGRDGARRRAQGQRPARCRRRRTERQAVSARRHLESAEQLLHVPRARESAGRRSAPPHAVHVRQAQRDRIPA